MAYLIVRETEQSNPRCGMSRVKFLRGKCKNERIGMDWLLWDVFRPTSQSAEEIYPLQTS